MKWKHEVAHNLILMLCVYHKSVKLITKLVEKRLWCAHGKACHIVNVLVDNILITVMNYKAAMSKS